MNTSLSLCLCSSVKSTFFLQLKDRAEVARLSLCCYCVDFSSRQSSTQRRSELSAVSVHFKALKSSFHDQWKKKKKTLLPLLQAGSQSPYQSKDKGVFLGVPLLHKDQTEGGYRPKTRNGEKTFLLFVGCLLSSNHQNTGGRH